MINSIKNFFNKIICFFKKSDEINKEEKPKKKQDIKKPIIKKDKLKEKIEKVEEKKKFKHSAIVDKDIWE